MLSNKNLWDLPDPTFEHLLTECGVAVDYEEDALYVYRQGALYQYPLPQVEDLTEAGRSLVTQNRDQHHDSICGLPWLIAMAGAGLIEDPSVNKFALELTQELIARSMSSVEVVVIQIEKNHLISLIKTLGVDEAAKVIGVPAEILQQAYDALLSKGEV